jgi:large subunit ribosomal protein L24
MPKSTKSTISIKKGDQVRVIAGKDKGAEGKVIRVLREEDRVIVEGVNRIKKHTKVSTTQRGAKSGGIVTQEAAIHISNVMVVDGDNKPTKIGKRVEVTKNRPDGSTYKANRSVRISRKTGDEI